MQKFRTWPVLLVALAALLLGAAFTGCGDSEGETPPVAVATEEPIEDLVPTATEEPEATAVQRAAPTIAAAAPTASTASRAPAAPVVPPNSGYSIDVNVSNYSVRLMNGTTATQTIAPVGVGVEVDTGNYASTQTGLFYVHSMNSELTYDAPYDTYISHWIGFDSAKDNGFHSFLKDEDGNIVDASTGRVSNGCIRTGSAEAIYAFAEIGMPVYVHF